MSDLASGTRGGGGGGASRRKKTRRTEASAAAAEEEDRDEGDGDDREERLVLKENACTFRELVELVSDLPSARRWPGRRGPPPPPPSPSLPAEVARAVARWLTVARVGAPSSGGVFVEATGCSSRSSSPDLPISCALDVDTSTWWISEGGSMPLGRGREWIAFGLCERSGDGIADRLVRLSRFRIEVPPLPSGPLSVRLLQLEYWATGTSTTTTTTGDGDGDGDDVDVGRGEEPVGRGDSVEYGSATWRAASPVWTVESRSGWQTFDLPEPVDCAYVRVVCLSNQVSPFLRGDDEDDEVHRLFARAYSSVGFYHVKFE